MSTAGEDAPVERLRRVVAIAWGAAAAIAIVVLLLRAPGLGTDTSLWAVALASGLMSVAIVRTLAGLWLRYSVPMWLWTLSWFGMGLGVALGAGAAGALMLFLDKFVRAMMQGESITRWPDLYLFAGSWLVLTILWQLFLVPVLLLLALFSLPVLMFAYVRIVLVRERQANRP